MEEKVYDICYKCGKSDDNLTMNELNEINFDIYCDDCFKGKVNTNTKQWLRSYERWESKEWQKDLSKVRKNQKVKGIRIDLKE